MGAKLLNSMSKNKHLFFFVSFFIIIFISNFVFVNSVFASSVSNIIFTTSEQTIGVSMVSDIITIQSRDSTGTPTSLGEKGYLYLTSSSITGEFSASSTSWLPITEQITYNSNWKNKNFYYKDSTPGTYTLTILADGKTWIPAIQNITIIDPNPPIVFSADKDITSFNISTNANNSFLASSLESEATFSNLPSASSLNCSKSPFMLFNFSPFS